ncbi:MAG TPA: prolyl oligopeptidase family serine peptidase, partial [Candidatus Limnocylindrales bacterium]
VVPLGSGGRGAARRLTTGGGRDSRPRISPDGRRAAFLRRDPKDTDSTSRLMLVDVGGKRPPAKLATGTFGVADLAWSPDGERLAFTAEVDPPRFIVGDHAAGGGPRRGAAAKPSGAPLARRIRRIDWRYDEAGHVDRWEHLFVIPATRGGRPVQLTAGDHRVDGIAWRPDGGAIAFAADRGAEADLHPRSTIWLADAGATKPTEPKEILALAGWANSPAWSPDGRLIAAVGIDEPAPLDDVSPGVHVAPADGSRPPVALAPDLDRPIGDWVDTDLEGWMTTARFGPFWPLPDRIVTTVSDRGRSAPWAFPVDATTGRPTGDPQPLVRADVTCRSLAVAAPGGRLVTTFVGTSGSRAMELMTVESDAERPQSRTSLGSRWQRAVAVPEMRVVEAPGPGGPIETWIASPPGAGDAPLPTIVDVHGGPLGAWAPAPSIEVHLLTARGYRVVLPNIRGSTTYGRRWIREQLGDWGGADAADVNAALDHVVGLGLADPERLGALGLSYGGFMIHWLIGTSQRFRAAVSENGVVNQISDWANSDTAVEYNRSSLLGDPLTPEGVAKLWRQSPLAHVANIRTPLLMFQGEADRTCPAADNEQLFIALRVLGREVEYILYPDEFHTFSITGRPDRRIDRMTRMLDWFDAHLLG